MAEVAEEEGHIDSEQSSERGGPWARPCDASVKRMRRRRGCLGTSRSTPHPTRIEAHCGSPAVRRSRDTVVGRPAPHTRWSAVGHHPGLLRTLVGVVGEIEGADIGPAGPGGCG